MNKLHRYYFCLSSLLSSSSIAATVDVGWDAANLADGSYASWAASPNLFGTTMTWNGTVTKTSGTSNFPNIQDWVSSPDYNLAGGSADSWHDANGPATTANVSWEFVFRPGSFTGNRHLFNTGGNGLGTAFLLEGSVLRFIFQQADNGNQRVSLSYDLASVGTVAEFYHIVGTANVDSSTTGTGQLFVNGVSVAGPTVSVGVIDDWDGGDLASLGSSVETHNIPTTTTYSSQAFTGDLAYFNFYGGEILTQVEIDAAYAALVPEPTISFLSLLGLSLLSRRRR